MLQMIIYSITIMYTPGPVTITAANIGLNRKFKDGLPFYAGVSLAIFVLYILIGFFGSLLLPSHDLWPISLIGGIYMLYLAYKIFLSNVDLNKAFFTKIGFRDGFLMQIFNPKAIIAVMPVVTIYFPQLNITGIKILYMAIFFTLLVFGAPALYAIIGQFFSDIIQNQKVILFFNKIMSLILTYIALSILYHDLYLRFF
ncbi:putative threonine efflux protein [Desulfosporosinus orientis DSM 765]|uniref:Putative threonine efflux protein n=1 Tax=Desulfosporosinus orientis (strain ATCC 19365 / DSM 765 / NCIMB 8382 / VKM B-1628 / Singapore I) TaxID=768706 RepID=G7WGG4_DESOD|nr:LysE family transporter [Desulfosporosinus orientis]AET68041.1 putative threonine efflux protein [Desulfosporosinus orientis DSM 765]